MTKEYDNLVVLKGPKELENWKFLLEVKAKKKGVWNIISIAQAANLIVQTTSSSLIPHIHEFPGNPYKMWKCLLEVNSHGFEDVSDMWTHFNALRLCTNKSSINFIRQFWQLYGDLTAAKEQPPDTLSISVLLTALPDETKWNSFKNQILQEYSHQNPDDNDSTTNPAKEALAATKQAICFMYQLQTL
ncbi:hypothetical protein D9758_010266 [Tetrapyrgos nigripes]|uniref:Gag protein n=1 Tax=Tetrapyrgos nigripes TaxID=182062 RepID=A0A8H5GAP9_9AGAR|nr:hypothetical protein D9758_010266 [Tetrapyrgos nigripes]